MTDQRVFVDLTRAQALVLFELLSRPGAVTGASFEHEAEERVLWIIEGQLEKVLTEPLAADYRKMLDEARREVCVSK